MGRIYRSITGQHSRSAEVYKYLSYSLMDPSPFWPRGESSSAYMYNDVYPVSTSAVHQNGRSLKLRNLYDVIAIALYILAQNDHVATIMNKFYMTTLMLDSCTGCSNYLTTSKHCYRHAPFICVATYMCTYP